MHPDHSTVRIRLILLLFIGFLTPSLNAETEEPDLERLAREHKVYVEPSNVVAERTDGRDFGLKSYRERRDHWGFVVGVEYSSYQPSNYEPNFAPTGTGYGDVYASPSSPMVELHFLEKRNLSVGSVGLEVGGGVFDNSHSDPTYIGSTLSLIPIYVGGVFSFDMIYKEPYFVPYVAAGAYSMIYKESLSGNTYTGNTQPAPYVTAGVAFDLNIIDPDSARIAYLETGLEAAYLFAELRSLMKSSNSDDPDLSKTIFWTAGFRVEY